MNLIFLDTECTGTEAEDRIIQLAYKAEGEEILNQFCKPPLPIKIGAMAVHHIAEAMVADKPALVSTEIAAHLEALLAQGSVVVAHNAKFDIAMLAKEGLKAERFICTMKVAQFLDEKGVIESYSLQYLRYYLSLDVEASAHDAVGDILVLRALFKRLYDKIASNIDVGVDPLEEMVRISQTPLMIKKFNFGKYKGHLIEAVATLDRGYLQWLFDQKKKDNTLDEDWNFTLSHHLKNS